MIQACPLRFYDTSMASNAYGTGVAPNAYGTGVAPNAYMQA